jgi:iron(III) transport system permease protein
MILILVVLEKSARKRQRFHALGKQQRPIARSVLRGWKALLAQFACWVPVVLGFVLPIAVLASHSLTQNWLVAGLWLAIVHTVEMAGLAAIVTVSAGLAFVYALRQMRDGWQMLLPVTALGYAMPGAVLALGILLPLAAFDTFVADFVQEQFGQNIGLVLTGTTAALLFAYCIRFFAVAQNSVEAALGRVSPGMDMAARALGHGPAGTLWRVHLPMIRSSILVASLLIFVDAAKELPATLMLRPFNFETLATLTYNQASVENIAGASPSALIVTLVGILPVLILARATKAGW